MLSSFNKHKIIISWMLFYLQIWFFLLSTKTLLACHMNKKNLEFSHKANKQHTEMINVPIHARAQERKENKKQKTSFTRYSLIWKDKVGGAIVVMLISKYTHTQNRTMWPKWGLVYMPLTFHWEKQVEIASYFIFYDDDELGILRLCHAI